MIFSNNFLFHPITFDDKTVGIDEKKKDIEHNRGGFDGDSTHHVPTHPTESSSDNNGVLVMEGEGRPTNFFAQPGILAGKNHNTVLPCRMNFSLF
jgi:hypothetical protein